MSRDPDLQTQEPSPSLPTRPLVRLVGRTEWLAPDDLGYRTDASGGQALAEFAGRACYQSFDRPRPATATNAGFLEHILQVGHLSVLEHATATFYLTGVSRGLTHELLRHRHLSVSELSPRYLPTAGLPSVVPSTLRDDAALRMVFDRAAEMTVDAQQQLLNALQARASDAPDDTLARRQARQVAQSVALTAAATVAVVTGNLRAWRHFIGMRGTDSADLEIREVAVQVLKLLQRETPHAVADFRVSVLPDGTELAASPLVGEG